MLRSALVMLVLLLPTVAGAQLIDMGDRTLDDSTKLLWLDVTETTNFSYVDVAGGAGGWAALGWRHATLAEVCQLFTSYAIAPASPCGSGSAVQAGDGVRVLQGLLGLTRVLSGQQEDTFGFLENELPGSQVGRALLIYNLSDSSTAGVEGTSAFDHDDALPTHGHFLVRPLNLPPVADAGPDQTIFLGDVALLAGSAVDPDGDPIVGWEWEVISAPSGSSPALLDATTANAIFFPDATGDYVITFRAQDLSGDWSQLDAVLITVIENVAPTAVIAASPLSGPAPLTVDFDGTGSSDPEEGQLLFDWDFGDLSRATEPTATNIYDLPGFYIARLTVGDDHGNIDVDTVEITVTAPAVPSIHPIALYTLLPSLLVGVGLVGLRLRS
jgi:hypothetical protein